jgi:hypothetical protein
MPAGRRFKEAFARSTLVLGGAVVGLAIVELCLVLFWPLPFSPQLEYIPDGHIGSRLHPDRTYRSPGGGTVSVNNLGYRGARSLAYRKPPGVLRIVVLGGSSSFGFDADDAHVWTAVLERKLQQAFGPAVEVVNAAIPGTSAFEAKIHYLYRIRGMQPDVVLACHIWNGMKYFRAIEAGRPLAKGMRRPQSLEAFLKHFQTAWRVRNLYHNYVKPMLRENVYGESQSSPITEIRPGGLAQQWERQNYEDLVLLLQKDGVLPVLASEPGILSRANIHEPRVRAVVGAEMQGLTFGQILEQWEAVTAIIRDVARRNDAVFIDAYGALPHRLDVFTDHVHLTDHGNALMADVIFRGLVEDNRFRRRILRAGLAASGMRQVAGRTEQPRGGGGLSQ